MPPTRSADAGRPNRRQPTVSTACDFCRRRKIRCDGHQPCDKCQQHDRADTCHFQDRQRRQSSGPAPALHDAQVRIRQLENHIVSINKGFSPGGEEPQSSTPANIRQPQARRESLHENASNHAAASQPNDRLPQSGLRGLTATTYSLSQASAAGDSFSRGSTSRNTPAAQSQVQLTSPHTQTAGGHDRNDVASRPSQASPSPTSPTSSAVASIITDLGNPRHSTTHASPSSGYSSPGQGGARVMSSLRVNHQGESRYHGPTSASFSAHDVSHDDPVHIPQQEPTRLGASNTIATGMLPTNQQEAESLDPAWLKDRLITMAASERQQEVMHVVSGKLDFDGVEPELAIHLLNLHWNRQHHAYLVTYRPLFMRDMAAPSGEARYFSKLLFHAILFGAAKFSDRIDQVRSDVNDPSTAGHQFLQRVQQLLPEALIKSRITTVQALLLLACTHYARGSESAAWLHSGLAFRMAVDLGMNEDSLELVKSGSMELEELELRRRVIWAAYVIDKIHSLYQGRQASMERRNLYVPIEFYDYFEETEFWTPVAYHRPASGTARRKDAASSTTPSGYTGPIYSVSTFAELCRLTVIMEKIIKLFYAIDSGANPERLLIEQLIQMRAELCAWKAALPAHLCIDPASPTCRSAEQRSRTRPPNLISLHALYHALTILLNRPFLPHGHLRSEDAATGRSAWKACVDAASSISNLLNLYRQTVSMKGAPQLISYINFCAAGIHVRVAAQLQQRPPATASGEVADMAASSRRYELKALQQCLRDFEENQDPNPGVVKAKTVISNMAERAGILHLLERRELQGGLSPLRRDDSPTFTSGALVTSAPNGVTKSTSSVTQPLADSHSNLGAASIAITASQPRTHANDADFSMVPTPPYEIDFEAILSSFEPFETTAGSNQDNLFAGTADAAINSDILFGFLRDYDPPNSSANNTSALSFS